ncbi:MAG: hotdog domain-containing protein [Sulfurimonas sp.]|nr:hotdog domain-containing protein [Sulfurimonas sp.]
MKVMDETEEEFEIHDYKSGHDDVLLNTHNQINQALSGEIIKMEVGYVEVLLTTLPEMLADNVGLVHGGFIFSAADYAAMAAVNEPNVVLVASDCQFLSPVKIHDEVLFKAKVRHKEGRKRNVHVEGHVHDIKVFEGEFKTVITEKHILRLHLLDDEDQ